MLTFFLSYNGMSLAICPHIVVVMQAGDTRGTTIADQICWAFCHETVSLWVFVIKRYTVAVVYSNLTVYYILCTKYN